MSIRVRSWCCTININFSDVNPKVWDFFDELPVGADYLVGQLEEGEEGTWHYQLFIHFLQPKSLLQVKRDFLGCSWAHCEPCAGTAAENRTYCTKEETRVAGPWEYGRLPRQGERTDIHYVQDCIAGGMSLNDLYKDARTVSVAVRYPNGVSRMVLAYAPDRDYKTNVYIHWGPAGTGKTKTAIDEAIKFGGGWYKKSAEHKWWDGYSGQPNVILDEYDPDTSEITRTQLNELMDRYPYLLQQKGTFYKCQIRNLWITSNRDPRNWYPFGHDEQLLRRVTKIRKFTIPLRIEPIPTFDELEEEYKVDEDMDVVID